MAEGNVKDGKNEFQTDALMELPTSLFAGPFVAMMEGPMREMIALQSAAAEQMLDAFLPASEKPEGAAPASDAEPNEWSTVMNELAQMWQQFATENPAIAASGIADPSRWLDMAGKWIMQFPLGGEETANRAFADLLSLWESVMAQVQSEGMNIAQAMMGEATTGSSEGKALPRSDRRFRDPQWSDNPVFAMLHQAYLMAADQLIAAADQVEGLSPDRKAQLKFFTRLLTEALSPAHFPLTNPLVIERTLETRGENLLRGMEHFLNDLKAGQLSHTDKSAFEIGENIASTPGKVVYESPLFQLIQYTPTTETVAEIPLIIFPPWINRFYILDLTAKKSFVKWCLDHGLSVFMVSWKSADASMANIGWEDYAASMVEAIDTVRKRLKVDKVHTIGYCVAGTTLAATLAMLARRGEEDKVASATFFTAQVDFSEAGELKAFIDEHQLAAVEKLAADGFLDGRYLNVAFNLLRSPDLLWNYVINNYLLGEDYKAFDLLYWNGHGTNLPARFHSEYLRQLYQDNRLVVPDAITLNGTPIDLRRIKTPTFIQAGREDHIAPPESVWKATRHFAGPIEFMLAGSGHIAGVVNPPVAGKYQYWTLPENDHALPDSLPEFIGKAVENPGSWWGYWRDWIRQLGPEEVPVKGKRKPGGRGDKVIEDAPGRYVKG